MGINMLLEDLLIDCEQYQNLNEKLGRGMKTATGGDSKVLNHRLKNLKNKIGTSVNVLIEAIKAGNFLAVKYIIINNIVKIDACDRVGRSPLHYAVDLFYDGTDQIRAICFTNRRTNPLLKIAIF